MITRYTTKSGSIYEVRETSKKVEIRRIKLGQHHYDRGPERVAKRLGDSIGGGEWRSCRKAYCHGVGHIMMVSFDDSEKDIVTSYVTEIMKDIAW